MMQYGPTLGRPEILPQLGQNSSTQRVYYRDDDSMWVGCWADRGEDQNGCQNVATTDILLCDEHYEEIIPDGSRRGQKVVRRSNKEDGWSIV